MKKIYCDFCGDEIKPEERLLAMEQNFAGQINHSWTKLIMNIKFNKYGPEQNKNISYDLCWSCCSRILFVITLLKKRDSKAIRKLDKLLMKITKFRFRTTDDWENLFRD